MDAQHTARQAYQLECKADIQIARINDRINALHAEKAKWLELRRSAIYMQDYLTNGPECFPNAVEELHDACFELGVWPTASESTVPAGAM